MKSFVRLVDYKPGLAFRLLKICPEEVGRREAGPTSPQSDVHESALLQCPVSVACACSELARAHRRTVLYGTWSAAGALNSRSPWTG